MYRDFLCLIQKECLLFYRSRQDMLNGLLFFLMIASVFPLTLNLEEQQLQQLAPGVIWVSALLASLLSMPQLFRDDWQDGSLAQMLLSRLPTSLVVFSKIIAHWLIFSLPLILLSPLLALLFHLSVKVAVVLILTLLLGTPVLHLLGAFIAALSVGLRQSNTLFALVLLPLFIPVLVFGAQTVLAYANDAPFTVPFLWLAALLILALTFMPLLAASALRISINY
jgi:heme exporter protein B